MIDRSKRSRWRNYAEQLDALGFPRWLWFKLQRTRSRFSKSGRCFRVWTPLARHALVFRADTSDTNVFSQIFLHREYRCLDDVVDPRLIVDCGANVGYSSAYLLSRFPHAHVIAIEPDSGNCAALHRNLAAYRDRCTIIQAGVWSRPGGLVITEADPGTRQEWAITVRPALADETPTIVAVDLGGILCDSGFERISILKMDIEGSEAEVFSSNTAPWLDQVDNMVIELHGPECEAVFMAAIDGHGFEVSECEELTVCKQTSSSSAERRGSA